MSQFNFGTIDPYVVDGVQLAGMLNQWRDAIHSWHRGATRPSYVVPGMMWINDSAGAANWVVNVYISAAIGDRPIFNYDTTTGNITISASAGGTFTAATVLASAAANPAHAWTATGNPIDAKRWTMTVNAAGALVLSSLNDAGVVQQSFTFNRDGTTTSPAPLWRRLARIVTTAGQATIDVQNIAADINDLHFIFDLVPTTNAVDLAMQFYDNTGALDGTAAHYANVLTLASSTQGAAAAPGVYGTNATGVSNSISLNAAAAGGHIGNTGGIRGNGTIANIRAARVKNVDFQASYVDDAGTAFRAVTGSGYRNQATAITGVRFVFGGSTMAANGVLALWGS